VNDKSVLIGCPVRNRAWILPDYLESLENIDYPSDKLNFCFIVNDSVDDTESILNDFARRSYSPVQIVKTTATNFNGHKRGAYRFEQLAKLRNMLLEKFYRSDCEYLLSVDSDILIPPDIINRLLSRNCQIISALVCNGHHINDNSIYNVMKKTPAGSYQHIKDFSREGIFTVDVTGAAYMIHRSVIAEHKVYYSARFGGEDIGFCEAARARGIPIYCDGTIECQHIMIEPGSQ
jgi:cellulose synthase/poly-beta-1,6-N-acetylglucosamine synthase-like glycosyltransferase